MSQSTEFYCTTPSFPSNDGIYTQRIQHIKAHTELALSSPREVSTRMCERPYPRNILLFVLPLHEDCNEDS